ncbi:MAG: archaeosortase/exosortase family protein [Flavobacteriales bacterium]
MPTSGPRLVPGPVLRDPVLRFLFTAGAIYLAWYLIYEFWIHPSGGLDMGLIDSLVRISGAMLRGLGHELIPEPPNEDEIRTIGIQGGHLLWIGDACNGAGLFAVFLTFLIAYPGPWKHKLWFGAAGLVAIHLINAMRVAALCIIVSIDYELLNFNHDYTFYIVVYGFVFLLWYIWVKRFAHPPGTDSGPA